MPKKLSSPEGQEKISRDDRTRNWVCVLYPESAPENWREIIDQQHVPWVESPLHDKDVNPDGTPKKHHWHVLLMYRGKKSFSQMRDLTDALNAPPPQKCQDARGTIRYMTHRDNPEKYQYEDEPIGHGGADMMTLCAPTSTETYAIKCAIEEYVCEHGILEYGILLDRLRTEGLKDMHMVAQNNTIYCNAYISSKRNMFEKAEKKNANS